jgi:Zn-dependent protease with chaperone function
MVLLPLAYVGLIVAAAYGVGLYATRGTVILQGSSVFLWRLVAYGGPLMAGIILVIFMIKPLFARHTRQTRPLELDLRHEPELRRLILAICAKVGAPIPSHVEVDCQVNASARLRRGLLSLGRDDLVLTIGLPLAGGLTARQFAGVLAHEFGHFAQGTGMAFSYLIRSINGWFARVVFERDDWDESLVSSAQEAGTRLAIVFWLSIAAVGLGRKVLHGLMLAGHAISCLQLRQMEFDADHYAAQVAGSAVFAQTADEIRQLGVASQIALGEINTHWGQQQQVNDIPGLVLRQRAAFSVEMMAQINGKLGLEKARWFDTHPSDFARSLHAKALNFPGLCKGEMPATALFGNFTELSRKATRHLYSQQTVADRTRN